MKASGSYFSCLQSCEFKLLKARHRECYERKTEEYRKFSNHIYNIEFNNQTMERQVDLSLHHQRGGDVTITNHQVKNYKLRSRNCHRCNCSHVSNIFQDNYPNSTGLSDTKIFQMQKYFVSQVWLPIIFNLHIKCILCPYKKIFLES